MQTFASPFTPLSIANDQGGGLFETDQVLQKGGLTIRRWRSHADKSNAAFGIQSRSGPDLRQIQHRFPVDIVFRVLGGEYALPRKL